MVFFYLLILILPQGLFADTTTVPIPDFERILSRDGGQCLDESPERSREVPPGAWSNTSWINPQVREMGPGDIYDSPEAAGFGHEFDLTMVIMRDSNWVVSEVEERVRKVADIYRQCGVRVNKASIVSVTPPPEATQVLYQELTPEVQGGLVNLALRLPEGTRPTMFFVRKFDDYDSQTGTSITPHANLPGGVNTAWISSQTKTEVYQQNYASKYSIEAHELTHVLGDCSHLGNKGELMAGMPYVRGNLITCDLCESIRSHSLVRKVSDTPPPPCTQREVPAKGSGKKI